MADSMDKKYSNVPNLRFSNESWNMVQIKELCSVVSGGTPSTEESSFWNGNIQWFTPTEVGNNKYVTSSKRTITELGLKKSSAKLLPAGSILLSTRATVGEASICTKECTTNQGFQSLIPNNKCCNEFLYYLIQTKKKEMIKRSCGSTFIEISNSQVGSIKVRIPSLEQQMKISKFLSHIDKRIDTQNKIISDLKIELEEISKKLFAMKNNEEKYLGDLCKITTGKLDANRMVPDGKYRFYTCAEHYYYIDEYAFDCEALLISGNGANVGYIHYYNGKFNAYQRTYVLSNFVGVDAHYLKSYLDVYLKRRIDSEKNTGNMPYIKLDTLSKMRIKTPTMVEQKKIAVSISNLSAKIETEQKILDLYLKQKSYLLKNLFI